ncbi:MAG: hypothetical protein WC488_02545 [Candidatus Micrarchaeia archaeon]
MAAQKTKLMDIKAERKKMKTLLGEPRPRNKAGAFDVETERKTINGILNSRKPRGHEKEAGGTTGS